MNGAETLILEVHTPEETIQVVDRMFSDLQVGGFAIRGFLDGNEIKQLVDAGGTGFIELEKFQQLAGNLAHHITGDPTNFSVQEFSRLIWSHDWHLPVNDKRPMIRPWLHLRGKAEFWLARSSNPALSGFGYSDSEANEISYARPVMFDPNPGDLLGFVDRGCPGVTGSSTIHKVDVPDWGDGQPRLSVIADILFGALS